IRFNRKETGLWYWGAFKESYEGVLTKSEDKVWGGDVSSELVDGLQKASIVSLYVDGAPSMALQKAPVGVLHVDVTPATARNKAGVSFVFLTMLAFFTLHCIKKQCRTLADKCMNPLTKQTETN